ncbi:methyltransferase domain-containing protein [Alteromonas sp. a30]|uniref:methyltransferase domain-containing protein n=1 Tax=Alteromonas sp. a30 TaxID=2730917 RepID=UPI0022830D47|nr:methyltransferase domain-containing protein [Alteromonas sp. a30]MCY7294001.1 methyltransferase domain-containing protein [Alteromonas sp. a30]
MMNSQQVSLKQQIAKQFSVNALQYDTKAKVQAEIGADAVGLWGKHHCDTLLDLGCGTGSLTQQLKPFSKMSIGLDLSLGMLTFAQSRTKGVQCANQPTQINWIAGDADDLPLQSNSVDGVFSSMALQWSVNIGQCLAEIYRVCRPNSKVLLGIMSQGSLHELQACWQALDSAPHINRFLHSQSLLDYALSAGFRGQVIERRYQSWHNSVRDTMHSIKDIGAGIVSEKRQITRLNKSRLAQMQGYYEQHFSQNGWLPLTYQLSFLELYK